MKQDTVVEVGLFKSCPKCGSVWQKREDFLADPETEIIGYQVNFKDLKTGLFLFNHLTCQTTLSLKAEYFLDLYNGPVFRERKTGTDACPGYCLYEDNLMSCPVRCECAYVRAVLNKLKKRSKERVPNL